MSTLSLRRLSARQICILALSFLAILFIAVIRPWHTGGQGGNQVTTVSAASFTPALAPEAIAAAFGSKLATRTEIATSVPLPTTLAGTTVKVNGVLAPLFFVSPTQINYLIPTDTAPGNVPVIVTSGDGTVSTGTVLVSNLAPAIFTANATGTGLPAAVLLRLTSAGQQIFERIDQPLVFKQEGDRLFLLLYLGGVRRAAPGTVKALIAGHELPTDFAAAPGFVGLDQVNVELPLYLSGRGRIKLQIKAGDALSNIVEIEMGGPDLRAATTTAVTSSANPAVAGQEVTFNVRVSAAGNARIPSGNLMLTENGMMIGKKPLDNVGQASFAFAFTSTGGRNIAASYEGDNFFKESIGVLSGQQSVNKAQATVTLSSSANPANLAQAVMLTAEVRPVSPSAITPTGIVQFKENNAPLGTPITLVSGRASFSVSTLALGARNITAEYYGDPRFQPVNSAAYTQTVGTAPLQITAITRTTPVYASEEITINGSGFTANPADHEVKVIADDGKETTGQIINAAADQLRVRVPFGAGSGKVKVSVGGREIESAERMEIGTSVSGFVQEFKDGARSPVVGLPVALREASGRRIETVTNNDGSFTFKAATPALLSLVEISGQAANGLNYPAQVRKMRVLASRDNQYSGDGDLANIIEVKPNSTTSTGTLVADVSTSETLSVAAPASPEEIAGQITNGQVTFDTNNSTISFPPGSNSLTLTVLDPRRTPANLPVGRFSSTIAQITPFGATLNPGGKLTFPNSDGIAPGTPVRLFRLDQTSGSATLGQFVDIGTATISADGTKIETAGNAVTQTSYYFVSRQWPTATIIGHVIETDGRPVRRAVVNARGQSVFTDNNGGFVLANVPVITPDGTNDQVTIEISHVRADGRVAFTQRSVTINANDSLTLNQDFVLPPQQINRQPQIIAPTSVAVTEVETRDFNLIVTDPDGQTVALTVAGAGFAALLNQGNGIYTLRLAPGQNSAGAYTLLLNASDSAGLTSTQNVSVVVQRSNNSNPTANYVSVTTSEDTAAGITLSARSPNGGALSYTLVSTPAHGSLAGTGVNRSYTPAPDYNGLDSFSYKVNDGNRESNVATVFIVVKPVNDAPVLTLLNSATSLNVNAGETLKMDLIGTDVDAEQMLNFTATGLPPGAAFIPAAKSAQFIWTPIFVQKGSYTVNFTVLDNNAPMLSDTRTMTITVDAKWAKTSGLEGGHIAALLVNGTSIFAGIAGGGVFISANGGRSWQESSNGLLGGALAVSAFSMNGTSIFAGTSNGVYRSNDNGGSWVAVNNGFVDKGFYVISLVVSGNTLFAGTSGGIYRSVNNGQSWVLANQGLALNPTASVTAFAMVGGRIFAGLSPGGVFVSNDQGQSWTAVNTGLANLYVNALVASGSNLFAATSCGDVYRSIDGGQNWVSAKNGLPDCASSLAVIGANIFAGSQGIFVSSDQGQSWRAASTGLPKFGDQYIAASSFVSNGSSILAGTFGKGVYVSSNQGQSWTASNAGLTGIALSSFAISSTSIFAGSYNSGMYRSNNSGQSWAEVNTGLSSSGIHALAVSGSTLISATTAGVFTSRNNGENWTDVNFRQSVTSFIVSGPDVFAGTAYSGVYRSTNNGQSWTAGSIGLPKRDNNLYFWIRSLAASGINVFAGTDGRGVYRSVDQGQSWTVANTGLTSSVVTALAFKGTTLFAGTYNGCFRSTNYGQSWEALGPNINIISLLASEEGVFIGTAAGVYRLADDGQTWTGINTGLTIPFVHSLALNGTNLLAGTFGGGVFVLANQSQDWSSVNVGLANKFINSVVVSGATLLAGTLGGGVYRSANNGQNWTLSNTGMPSDANVYSLTVSNAITIFAGTYGDGVFRSTDQGKSWTMANNGLTNKLVNTLAASGLSLFAATDGSGVFRSTDQGQSWVAVNAGLLNLYVLTLIVDGTTLYAGTDGGGVFVSTNNGQSWTQINSGLTALDVRSFAISGSTLFCGTLTGGIFRLTNSGQTWVAVSNGLPLRLPVFAFAVSGSKLYAGTVYGVFVTEDNGASWKQINAGLLDIYTTSLAVSGKTLIAGTRVGGVFTSQIP